MVQCLFPGALFPGACFEPGELSGTAGAVLCPIFGTGREKAWGELDELVAARERQVKGDRAKLHKPHEYCYNQERPIHDYPLDFRFGRANVIVQDILNGLGG